MNVVAVSDRAGKLLRPDLLAVAEGVHRQLRRHLRDYEARMKQVLAAGAEMAVAEEGGKVLGVAVFRILEKTHSGRELYCDTFSLDSGTQRQQAHKFYFREGMVVTGFHFEKKLASR